MNIIYAAQPIGTEQKTLGMIIHVNPPQQAASGLVTLWLSSRPGTANFPITIEPGQTQLSIDTQLKIGGTAEVPEVAEGSIRIQVGQDLPYEARFVYRGVGFACQIEHHHNILTTITV